MRALSAARWHISTALVALLTFVAALPHDSIPMAVLAGAVATVLWLVVWMIDQAPQPLRVAGSGLFSGVSLRLPIIVSLVLSAAHDVGLYPIGTLEVVVALFTATVCARAAARLWRPGVRVLIVGSGEVARHVGRLLAEGQRATVVGYVDDHGSFDDGPSAGSDAAATPVVGSLQELRALVASHQVDGVVFGFSTQRDREVVRAMRACRDLGVSVSVVPRFFQELDQRAVFTRIAGLPILTIDPTLGNRRLPTLTRVLDVLTASLLCIVLAPVFLLIALAIVIESPGPVFYRARRVGQGGGLFDMLKFRKMRRDARGPRITTHNDARFTRIGRFLHASKLDELPQLWNVIRGDMTLVGPRPEDPEYVALYPDDYNDILRLRPGITGLAAVKYRYETDLLTGSDSETHYRKELLPSKIAMERAYADRRTFGLDLRILLWTAVALLRGVRVTKCPVTEHWTFAASSRD